MFKIIHNWIDRRIIRRSNVTEVEWDTAFVSLPLLVGYTSDEKLALQNLATLFLHHKKFEGAHGLVVSQAMKLYYRQDPLSRLP